MDNEERAKYLGECAVSDCHVEEILSGTKVVNLDEFLGGNSDSDHQTGRPS